MPTLMWPLLFASPDVRGEGEERMGILGFVCVQGRIVELIVGFSRWTLRDPLSPSAFAE